MQKIIFLSPLRSGDRRGVNLELVRFSQERGCGFKSPDVRTVAELGLCVTPDHLKSRTRAKQRILSMLFHTAMPHEVSSGHAIIVSHNRSLPDCDYLSLSWY